MFEIHKRHKPMFNTSEVKTIADALTSTLQMETHEIKDLGVEILPVFHTARINEFNPYIISSHLNIEEVKSILDHAPGLETAKNLSADLGETLDRLVMFLVQKLNVDSYFRVGNADRGLDFVKNLPMADRNSKKPVVVFDSFDFEITLLDKNFNWMSFDLPAIWLNNIDRSKMSEMDAFFALTPTVEMEVTLNRFQKIKDFGKYAVGLVRF